MSKYKLYCLHDAITTQALRSYYDYAMLQQHTAWQIMESMRKKAKGGGRKHKLQ